LQARPNQTKGVLYNLGKKALAPKETILQGVDGELIKQLLP